MANVRMLSRNRAAIAALVLFLLCGCARIARVKGKVTAEGKDVSGGGIVLSPLAGQGADVGRPGLADVAADGTFSLEVELSQAGANRFAVRFSPPTFIPTKAYKDAVTPYAGYAPKQSEIELQPGDNQIAVELTPPGKRTPGK